MAAEAEAVGHHVVDACFAGDVGDVVEVATFAGIVEVDRRGRTPVWMARAKMISSTPPEAPSRWPSWLLVLETGSLRSVTAEDGLHRHGFGEVAERRCWCRGR